jgi:hypothetical protein
MKTLVCLAALLSFVGIDVAAARVRVIMQTENRSVSALARVSYKTAAPAARKPAAKSKARRKARKAAPRKTIVARRALVTKAAPARRQIAMRDDSPTSAPDHPGWFKAPGRAGYGMSNGKSETMLGLYTRPERPDLPGPQIYHTEPRGAAGVSLSLKLGH